VALLDIEGGDLAAGGLPPAGELLTGNIGSLREWQLLKALRAPCGPIPQYKMSYYIVLINAVAEPPANANAVATARFPDFVQPL
jgi:hypothetical protein